MTNHKPGVTLILDEVMVSLVLPHGRVDTETLIETAMAVISNGKSVRIVPRFDSDTPGDGPEFEAYIEVMTDPTIIEDEREEKPDEFDPSLKWWRESTRENNAL